MQHSVILRLLLIFVILVIPSSSINYSSCLRRVNRCSRTQWTWLHNGLGNFVPNPNRSLLRQVSTAIGRLHIAQIPRNSRAGTLVSYGDIRIDLQGFTTNQDYANIQVQWNRARGSQSTTFGQLFIPTDLIITPRFIRYGLLQSVRLRKIITLCLMCTETSRHDELRRRRRDLWTLLVDRQAESENSTPSNVKYQRPFGDSKEAEGWVAA